MNEEIKRLELEIGLNDLEYDNSSYISNHTYSYGYANNQTNNTTTTGNESKSNEESKKEEKKKIKYKPYTLEQYKQTQPKEYVEIIPKLRPGS